MAFKMKGPAFYKSALKHGKHTKPQKTKYSDVASDRSLHYHGVDGEYIPVKVEEAKEEEKSTKKK